MLNINGKLLDELNENEYYLISILLNYGKKSRPDNGVLMHRTGWGLQKLQKVKNSLIDKGLVEVIAKFDRKDKSRGRASNEYKIKTPLCSKYNGVQLHDFKVIEIQLDENQLHEIQLDDFKLDENHADKYVLKLSVIEKVKLLKEKERGKALSQIKELEKQLKESQLALKTEKENQRKKVAPKKESDMDRKQKIDELMRVIPCSESEAIEILDAPTISMVDLVNSVKKQLLKTKEQGKEKSRHVFPDLTSPKTYVPKSPKQELENGQKKPYEIFLSSYPFEKKGWSEKLKQIFLTYCEIKNEKSYRGYATAQIKLRLAEINEAISKHEINWIEEIVTSGANGAWADFQFDERIKNRKDKAEKESPINSSNPLFMRSESLNHRNTWNK